MSFPPIQLPQLPVRREGELEEWIHRVRDYVKQNLSEVLDMALEDEGVPDEWRNTVRAAIWDEVHGGKL